MPYKFVCTECQSEYHVKEQGVLVIEMASFGVYKVWNADLLECRGCQKQVVSGFGDSPLMEHYEKGFNEWLELLKKNYIANHKTIVYDYERPQIKSDSLDHRKPFDKNGYPDDDKDDGNEDNDSLDI
jgi:hypothetical protein